jgi:hypothetical protein
LPHAMGTASDLDTLLEALDRADTAVRALYRQLAENPDLAAEYDAGLRELQRKRLELAHQVGIAALRAWRAARSEADTPVAETAPASAVVTDHDTNGVSSAGPPPTRGTEPVATLEHAPPTTRPALADPPASTPSPPASDAQLEEWKKAVQARGLGASRTLPPAPERPWGALLHEMMCLLGPPDVDLNDSVALLEELDALDEIATPERQKLWVLGSPICPRPHQRASVEAPAHQAQARRA